MSPAPNRKAEPVAEAMSERELSKALGADVISTSNGTVAVNQPTPDYASEDLVNLTDWSDLDQFITKYGVDVIPADKALGDGFSILSTDDKARLIGRKMMLIDWRFNSGAQGEFVSMRALVQGDGGQMLKYIINDGSTGVKDQLKKFTHQTGKQAGLFVEKGLRVSEYMYEAEEKGVKVQRPAKTYYIDTSA